MIFVVDGQGYFGERKRFAFVGTVENDIFHTPGTKRFGRLFTQNPFDGIDDVALPAAVRTEKTGDAIREIKMRFVSERFEPLEIKTLEKQPATILDVR